jgi:hypothetical protein
VSQQSEYTFILKVAVVLVVAWALMYRPAEDELIEIPPEAVDTSASAAIDVLPSTPETDSVTPSPDLIAAITEGAAILEADPAEVFDSNNTAPTERENPGLAAQAAPGDPSPAESPDGFSASEASTPDSIPAAATPDSSAEDMPAAAVKGQPDETPETAANRRLLSLRDAAYLDEVETNANAEKKRLKLEYETKILEEREKLAIERKKLSELYEDEIAELRAGATEQQRELEERVAQLKQEAADREERLRQELAELQLASARLAEAAPEQPLPPEGHQQAMTFQLEWGEACGSIDKKFLETELAATPTQPLYLSIEPLFPEKTYFAPLRIALPPERVLTKSSTTVSFYTGDKPLSLAVFICKDVAKDGRCLRKPPVTEQQLLNSLSGAPGQDFHQQDKSYFFAYMLAVKDKLYLLDPTQGEKYYERLEKALTLLSIPADDVKETIAKIRAISEKMSPSYMRYSDRHFSLVLPEIRQSACRTPRG